MTSTPEDPCKLRYTAFADGLEPVMNPLSHASRRKRREAAERSRPGRDAGEVATEAHGE
jgi:hypothetical protein